MDELATTVQGINQLGYVAAVVTLVGFAIERSLELVKAPVSALSRHWAKGPSDPSAAMTVWTEKEIKATIMGVLSLLMGVVVVWGLELRLLSLASVETNYPGWMDFIISAIIISAGTEGANKVTTYLEAIKLAKKSAAAPPVSVEISPDNIDVAAGKTYQFHAKVTNAKDPRVLWTVEHGGGGTIDASGVYEAPNNAGTYHVRAKSWADPSATSMATVTVTTT